MRAVSALLLLALAAACPGAAAAETGADSARGAAADRGRVVPLPPITVSATRLDRPLARTPAAVDTVGAGAIAGAGPAWGLDEALATVPGVYASDRYNFSLDQRISIRGFGARSAFAIRGIRVLLDGIPQTLPDGQGQLTNVELGAVDRIEVLRGPSSALFGNASGGVVSIWTSPTAPQGLTEELRVAGGSFGGSPFADGARGWAKGLSVTRMRLGPGSAVVTASRLLDRGARQHAEADLRNLNVLARMPLGARTSLIAIADVGRDPRADNPGALTAAELRAHPDSAAALNVATRAGKSVTQAQGGLTLHRTFGTDGELDLTVHGVLRALTNPTTFAWIDLHRRVAGARLSVARTLGRGAFAQRLVAGMDAQGQRDDRLNRGNAGGVPDTIRTLDQLERVTEVGPFVQTSWPFAPRLALSAGARYDWVAFAVRDRLVTAANPDDSGRRVLSSPSGSVGLDFTPADALTAWLHAGTSFETPTTTELANRPDAAGGFNPGLAPQRAAEAEAGLRVGGRAVSGSIAAYRAAVRDELVPYQVPSVPGRVFYRNAGRARHQGVEAALHLSPWPGLEATASWTLQDFRYTRFTLAGRSLDGRPLPGVPRSWTGLLVRARPAFARGAWLEAEERGSAPVPVSDTLEVRADGWWRTDLRLGWDGVVGGVRVSPYAAVQNLFDRRYVSSVVIDASFGRFYEPAPGRNVYLGIALQAGR